MVRSGVKQDDGSEWVVADGLHCVTEKYFMDVQQACIAFYEHDDVVVQVRAGVVCEVDVRVRAAQPTVRVRAVQRLVLRRERGAADRRLDSEGW